MVTSRCVIEHRLPEMVENDRSAHTRKSVTQLILLRIPCGWHQNTLEKCGSLSIGLVCACNGHGKVQLPMWSENGRCTANLHE